MKTATSIDSPLPADERWQHFVRTHDVDEHAGSAPGWRFQYDQLSKGPFVGTLHHVQLPGLRLVHEYANCAARQRGEIGTGLYGMGLTLDAVAHASFNGHVLGRDTLMAGALDSVDISSAPNFAHVALIVDEALLDEAFQSMYGRGLPALDAGKMAVDLQPEVAARVRAAHLDAMRQLMARPEILDSALLMRRLRDDILSTWIAALPFELDDSALGSVASRKQLVDRACEAMLARQEVSMLDICAELNTSRRKLEYSFKESIGMSPAKYLRAVRLNQARRDLKRAGRDEDSVYDVASRWGFWHHGEFSASYMQLFGELPSATQKAARRVIAD